MKTCHNVPRSAERKKVLKTLQLRVVQFKQVLTSVHVQGQSMSKDVLGWSKGVCLTKAWKESGLKKPEEGAIEQG